MGKAHESRNRVARQSKKESGAFLRSIKRFAGLLPDSPEEFRKADFFSSLLYMIVFAYRYPA